MSIYIGIGIGIGIDWKPGFTGLILPGEGINAAENQQGTDYFLTFMILHF